MEKLSISIKTVLLSITVLAILFSTADQTFSEENSIKDIVTDLYNHYESVDRELKELKELAVSTDNTSPLTPFSIGIKKEAKIDFISIDIDKQGIPLASHLYSERDNKALSYGSRHLIYKGKIKKGKQTFVLYYTYKTDRGVIKSKATWKITLSKKTTYLELIFKEKNGKIIVVPRKTTTES